MTFKRAALVLCAALAAAAADREPLRAQSSSTDIILHPGRTATVAGGWAVIADSTAAEGAAVLDANAGAPKLTTALAAPTHYFDVTFTAEAGVPYRLWMRGKAQSNYWGNDSVFVQFSGSLDTTGAVRYRTGTTSALTVNLEDCSGCGLSGWGWQDTGWGVGVLGPEVMFASTGTQRMRVQTREDGLEIDQIILSPQRYLTSSPGALKNDTTIVSGSGSSTVSVVRRPYLQQMSSSRVVVVFATRQSGTPRVTVSNGSSTRTVSGTSRLVPNSRTLLGFDYYHHEVTISSLSANTTYGYDATLNGIPVASASFRTAPSKGTGAVSFIIFGDSGTGSSAQRQLAAVMAKDDFDFALHGGDIVYGSATGGDATYATYNSWLFDVYSAWMPSKPFFPVEGNHDSRPSNGNGVAYLDTFTLPTNGASAAYPDHKERYYSYDYGPIHFVALDTEFTFLDATRRAEQLSWLESDLAATSQPWKIAYFHRPPYSSGSEHGSDLTVRAAFGPIFERYGVQLVLSGHDHDYERTLPQDGVTYVVSGGGGAFLYSVAKSSFTAYAAARHHYVHVDVDSCTLELRAIGLDGSTFDSETLSRCASPPPADGDDVVLYASEAPVRKGLWQIESDPAAAGGQRLRHPDRGAPKLQTPLASPSNYFEMTFTAEAGIPYRLWIRGKAQRDYWGNDSVFVQFDGSVTKSGSSQFRIGTTSATTYNLEECSGCGLSAWGWEDNGWGRGVLGPQIYFARSGTQRVRVQTREDGLVIDQIVLSPDRYLTTSPGSLKNDTTILQR